MAGQLGLRLWFKWENCRLHARLLKGQRWFRGMRRREQHCKILRGVLLAFSQF